LQLKKHRGHAMTWWY